MDDAFKNKTENFINCGIRAGDAICGGVEGMISEEIVETAKATQEVAKTVSNGLDKAGRLGAWLDRIFGAAIGETVAATWTVNSRERHIAACIYSWERLEVLMQKTEQRLRKRGITHFRFVPPKVVLPLLQNATAEDDDQLHTLWAALLATSLDARSAEVHRKYVSILADLTSEDADVLDRMWKDWVVLDKKKEFYQSVTVRYGPGVDGTGNGTNSEASVVTINRLGLIQPNYTKIGTYRPPGGRDRDDTEHEDEAVVIGDLTAVIFTKLGEGFCNAVITSEIEQVGT